MRIKEPFVVVRGKVRAEFSDKADIITLTSDLIFIIPDLNLKITLKKGFQSNGASLPRWLWRFIGHPFFHSYLLAALLHDALYQTKLLARRLADWIFRTFMAQLAKARIAVAGRPPAASGEKPAPPSMVLGGWFAPGSCGLASGSAAGGPGKATPPKVSPRPANW